MAESTEETQGQQFSPAFIERMGSLQAATEGIKTPTYQGPNEGFDFSQLQNQQPAEQPTEQPAETQPTETAQPPVDAAPTEQAQPSEQQPTEQPAQPTETPQEGHPQTEEVVVESDVFGSVNLGPADPAPENPENQTHTSFETVEDFNKYFESGNFGGLTADNFQEELPKLVEKSQKFEETNQAKEAYESVLKNIPASIYDAIVEFGNGGDWRAKLREGATSFDYEKQFSDHSVKQAVDSYLPNKVSQDDWDEYNDPDGDAEIKSKVQGYIDLASEKYKVDQDRYKMTKENYERQANELVAKKQDSFNVSRANAIKEFEDAGFPVQDSYLQGIDKTMTDEMILSMFKNPDGTYKDDCHRRLIMANDGMDLVKKFHSAAQRNVASQVRTEMLEGTADSQAIKRTGDAQVTEQQKIEDQMRNYVQQMAGNPQTEKSVFGN